jgi:23S rRNA (adenine2030-N6)-methyltransferase
MMDEQTAASRGRLRLTAAAGAGLWRQQTSGAAIGRLFSLPRFFQAAPEPMNYRHAFHAGNFADVVKHVILARAIAHLRLKDTPFRVIDTHAGSGRYNLESNEAIRGGEWRQGIARIWEASFSPAVEPLMAPYLEAVRAHNPDGQLKVYPGSPLLIRHWLRPQDRLIACELEPVAAQGLARQLRSDARTKAIAIDGWTGLSAYIPPKERRGLVLIDPPFEERDELKRLSQALAAAHRKWEGGMILAWYPIKDMREIAKFIRDIAAFRPASALRLELIREDVEAGRLRGTGMIAINPPWTLEEQARLLLPELAAKMTPEGKNSVLVEPLANS